MEIIKLNQQVDLTMDYSKFPQEGQGCLPTNNLNQEVFSVNNKISPLMYLEVAWVNLNNRAICLDNQDRPLEEYSIKIKASNSQAVYLAEAE